MSEHTPGPWHVLGCASYRGDQAVAVEMDHGFRVVSSASYDTLAEVPHIGTQTGTVERVTAEANAHLFAAAPDLLTAARELVASIRGKGPRDGKLLARADAAIARATPQPPTT